MGQTRHLDQRYRLLFERYWRAVLAYSLRRTSDAATAEDVVAEVFSTAWRRIADIPEGRELPWLYSVARFVLSNSHRGQMRRDRLVARLQGEGLAQGGFMYDPEPAIDDERLEHLRVALYELSDNDQEILKLATWEQLPHAEIAQVLDCTVNAVAIRLHRARQRLAEKLPKDVDRSGHAKQRFTPDPVSERQ